MSNKEDTIKVLENTIVTLEKRIRRLEEEMALCLRWMRVQAELEAKKKDPNFVVHDYAKA